MSAAELLNPRALIPCERSLAEASKRTEKTENTQSTRERQRQRAKRKTIFKKCKSLCVYTIVLSSTIYTSPRGTDRSTAYFNAHTSVWHWLRDYNYLVIQTITRLPVTDGSGKPAPQLTGPVAPGLPIRLAYWLRLIQLIRLQLSLPLNMWQ